MAGAGTLMPSTCKGSCAGQLPVIRRSNGRRCGRQWPAALAAVFILTTGAAGAQAGDVAGGTLLTAENWDELKSKTLEGHAIEGLVPEPFRFQMREQGLTLELVEATPYPPDPGFEAATRQYAGDVTFDPETGEISGWKAGVPFPDVDALNDPHGAIKVVWNTQRGRRRGDTLFQDKYAFLLIDGNAGPDRVQVWEYRRFDMKGRYALGADPVLGDGSILEKEINIALLPQDIKGVGTFTIRYDTGQVHDSWAYIRDLRRVRRLSGGSWMEPIGSTDIMGDDFAGFSAYPTWYDKYEIIAKTHALVVANAVAPAWIPEGSTVAEQFPHLDLTTPPYWTVRDRWEIRPVYVINAIAPDGHSQSRKVLYVDTETWNIYYNFGYDRAGELQKIFLIANYPYPYVDQPGSAIYESYAMAMDFQRNHASLYAGPEEYMISGPLREEDVSLATLEAGGR